MTAQNVDLILFMGQSNMAGRGEASEAPKVQAGTAFEFRASLTPPSCIRCQSHSAYTRTMKRAG